MVLSATQSEAVPAAAGQWSVPPLQTLSLAEPATGSVGSACHCGDAMVSCVGCGEPRCLTCDPYLSDDC